MPSRHPPSALSCRNLSDRLRLAIEKQFERFSAPVPGGPFEIPEHLWAQEMIQRGNEADFLVIALRQLLRLGELCLEGTFATDALRSAVADYRARIPHLLEVRDTVEHFDAYGAGVGWRQLRDGEAPAGFGYGIGAAMGYGEFRINFIEAVPAARDLHRAIRATVDPEASSDVHGGPETVTIPEP